MIMIRTLLIFSLFCSVLLGQTSPKEKFFSDYADLLDQVRAQEGEILSPEFFKRAIERFESASEDYDKKKSIKNVREKLEESANYARRALEIIKLAEITLSNAIESREEALSANAPLYAADEWEKGENELYKAATNLEDDDVDDARTYGSRATKHFQQAELLSIKNSILNDAREQIKLAKEEEAEKYAFHTVSDAENLLSQAIQILETDRYATDEAVKKASQAAYQGRHARYLAKTIKNISGKLENWEILILKYEEILTEMSHLFNHEPLFDEGMETTVKTLKAYIKNLKEEKKHLVQENERLQEELVAVKEREANYSAELEKKMELQKKIERVKNLFDPQEGRVIYEGDKLIIRLYGLNFPSGKAIIQPEYFSLLTKIQHSIREFSNSHVMIEGHTDALGESRSNKVLSEKRAKAVSEYIMANMELEPNQMSFIGFGEEKPVASNETREGRTLNRRIDVMISLEPYQ
jgi:outer membrane protein OmpA-like peptidoglycan-associated protein